MNYKEKYLKPRRPKGFKEYLPEEQVLFDSIYSRIEKVFQAHGFAHIVTPDLELSEIMLAKGGGETEKEVYRFTKGNTDYCMPYDLTIPTARYIAEHMNSIIFPFYRYQIQKRYRAENTQRGRAREFYQADIDIFGTSSINADAFTIATLYHALSSLGLPAFTIYIGHRGLWSGFLDLSTPSKITLMHLVDKKNKISPSDFKQGLSRIDISDRDHKLLDILLNLDSNAVEQLDGLRSFSDNTEFINAIEDVKALLSTLEIFNVPANDFVFDASVVRGLDYYNGMVFETFIDTDRAFGSIASGGRYNKLLEYFSPHLIPAVGGSIGLTRIFEYILEQEATNQNKTDIYKPKVLDVFIAYQPNQPLARIYSIMSKLQAIGMRTNFSLDGSDLSSQLRYAQKIGVTNVLIVKNISDPLILKNMLSGEQKEVDINNIIGLLCK